jgi:hypothetical protein
MACTYLREWAPLSLFGRRVGDRLGDGENKMKRFQVVFERFCYKYLSTISACGQISMTFRNWTKLSTCIIVILLLYLQQARPKTWPSTKKIGDKYPVIRRQIKAKSDSIIQTYKYRYPTESFPSNSLFAHITDEHNNTQQSTWHFIRSDFFPSQWHPFLLGSRPHNSRLSISASSLSRSRRSAFFFRWLRLGPEWLIFEMKW